MKSRIAAGLLLTSLASSLGGCASEPVAAPWQNQMSHLGAFVVIANDLRDEAAPPESPVRKSVASKVLSAMALERVTGLTADPARLLEID